MTVRRAPATKARRTVDEFNQHDDVVDLRTYALILWRRRWTIVITTILVTAMAVGLTFTQTPLYEAEAEVAIEPLRRSEDTSLTDLILGSAIVETERRVMTSGPVTEGVIETLQLQTTSQNLLKKVSVNTVRDTRVVTVRVTDPSPDAAAAIANTFIAEYLELRRGEALERLGAARDSLANRAAILQDELGDINADLVRAQGREDVGEVRALEAQRDSVLTQLAQVNAQQLTADAETDLVRGGGTVLRVATAPTAPSSPKPIRTGILAIVLGGMLGVGLAFGREFLDDGVHSEDVLIRASGGAPVFGRIPTWEQEHHRAVSMVSPHDHAVEAYRELRANVRFVIGAKARETEWEGRRRSKQRTAERKVGKSVLITSSIAGEGKSSTAANLAVVAAQGGAKIVLIDADMRRPQLANVFGIGASTGLSDHLAEGGDVSRRLVQVGMPNLSILPAGAAPPNPAELLSSRAMADLLTQLESTHDLVIIDSPPVLAVADALELAQMTSAVLLVASNETSSQRAIKRSVERLGHIGVLISGSVLNRLDRDDHNSYYGYYEPYAKASQAAAAARPNIPPPGMVPHGSGLPAPAPTPPTPAAPSAPAPATAPAPTEDAPTEAAPTTAIPARSSRSAFTPTAAPSPILPISNSRPEAPRTPIFTPGAASELTPEPSRVDVRGRFPESINPEPTPDLPSPAEDMGDSLWQPDRNP